MSSETTTHECPRCGDVHLPGGANEIVIPRQDQTRARVFEGASGPRPVSAPGHFEHERDCVLGRMESHPDDPRTCWRCVGQWVQ